MRILLSGMTRMQVNGSRRREYNTSINALYNALIDAKHSVEWRPIEYNEKKIHKEFDLLILGLGTMSEFSCQYLYNILLASRSNNVLYLVNDWKANKTIKLLQEGDLFREFVLKNNAGKKLPIQRVLEDRRLLETCRNEMFRQKDNLLGPFFAWGDRSIITEGTPFETIYEFNPSSFYLKYWRKRVSVPKVKHRQWVYGALNDYAKWHLRLGLNWPVHAFNKKTFIPEDALVELYAKSYGMLMPRYSASGSGWWRARFCHAMICENVIYADEKEWGDIAKEMYLPANEIEKLSPFALRGFAKDQNAELVKRTPRWDQVVDTIDSVIHEVVR